MKTYLLPIALATMAVSALAGAQTPPSASPPSSTTSPPSSSMQAPSTSGSSSYSSSDKAQLKECIAKQKASNAQISEADATKACKAEATTGN